MFRDYENCYKIVDRSKLQNNKELVYKDMLWKGGVYCKLPFGYGHYYDKEGNHIFSGFVFEGKRIGVGVECYPNSQSQSIAYYGLYMNDMRHGWGVSYDETGNVIYEGEWAHDAIHNSDNVVVSEEGQNYHNLVSFLFIEDNAFNDLTALLLGCEIFHLLEILIIGNNCLYNVSQLEIRHRRLKYMKIGNNSFGRCELFNVQQCEKLLSIIVDDNAFNQAIVCIVESKIEFDSDLICR